MRFYLVDLLKALHYCHHVIHVVHKDIKPDNIMIGHNEEAVLIDFGLAVECAPDLHNSMVDMEAGTRMYFAPEILTAKPKFGEKTDVWALGVTMYEALTGIHPFAGSHNMFALNALILENKVNFELIADEVARKTVKKMMTVDPEKRAGVKDLLKEDDWITANGMQ